MDILFTVLQWIAPLLFSILTILAIVGVKKLIEKMGMERTEKIDALIDKYVRMGVSFAEVSARKYLSEHGEKMTSNSKRSLAVKTILDELQKAGLKEVGESIVIAKIEGWLEDSGHKPGESDPTV